MEAVDRSRPGGRRKKIVARLEWETKASEYRDLIEAGNQKRPRRPPDPAWTRHLENPVEVDLGTYVLVRGYTKLSTCRTWTFSGAGAIPAWAVWQWCDRTLLDREEAAFAETVLYLVDHAMISKINARSGPPRKD